MTCSGLEFLHRPYPYPRAPFRLNADEKVAYEGRYFSIPAFGLLLDKRLFTRSASHPVTSTVKLYLNKDAALSSTIEPSLDASGYQTATPHYASYVIDMRNLLSDVCTRHAADSEFTADDFFRAHMQRNRAVYSLENTTASGTSDLVYVHPTSVGIVPIAPPSTTTPANQIELGALQFQDIDMDEIMWQPVPRPKSPEIGPNFIPIRPIFPAALPNGQLPEFSSFDEQKFDELGLNVVASGGVLITGDVLIDGTSIKLLTGSGQPGATEGDFVQMIEWARFPAGDQLNLYYVTENSGCVTASGRQAIYEPPAGLADDKVYLLDVSDIATSGQLIQTYPGNYHATSGIDKNGIATSGVHVVDRLMYSLTEMTANTVTVGRSLINGKKVFGHFAGTQTSTMGFSVNGRLKYANGDSIFAYGGIINPFVTSPPDNYSIVEWATVNNLMSPIPWTQNNTNALQPRAAPAFGGQPSTTWDVQDINAASDGVVWSKRYNLFGNMDRVVHPAADRAGGGEIDDDTVTFEIHVFREGVNPDTGGFMWVELPPPESPLFVNMRVTWYNNTYDVGNILTLFFGIRVNLGFVNVNGQTFIQWTETGELPQNSRFCPVSTASRTTTLVPPTSSSTVIITVGYFPTWALRLYSSTNNQIEVPNTMNISPANSSQITFAAGIPMTLDAVQRFGPAVWDPSTNLNYLYFTLRSNQGIVYFAKMNSSFQIIHINRVDTTDAILNGRSAILSI